MLNQTANSKSLNRVYHNKFTNRSHNSKPGILKTVNTISNEEKLKRNVNKIADSPIISTLDDQSESIKPKHLMFN